MSANAASCLDQCRGFGWGEVEWEVVIQGVCLYGFVREWVLS